MGFDPYQVTATEQGVVRLFTTDLEPEGDMAITAQNVHKLLGQDIELNAAKVEVFSPRMIEPIGMSTYLNEGHGIPEADLEGTAAALDAMNGLVIVIPTSAFKGRAVTLEPMAGIQFVGAFHEPRAAHPVAMAEPETAEGVLAPTGKPTDPFVRHTRGWMLALAALVAAAALVLFAVF